MAEFVSIKWLKPLLKELARIDGARAEELGKLSDIFGDAEELVRHYIEPKCQYHNPADRHEDLEPVSQIRAPAFDVINEFLSDDVPLRGGRTQMFILSDAGMGKTSLLMMLRLAHLTTFWPTGDDCLLLKLGEDTLKIVEQHGNKAQTVLLLDALDEDPLAWGNIEERLLAILKATERFRQVVISCNTQFFPETGADPFSNPGRVEVGRYICPMMFLSQFDENQVRAYLGKRFPVRWYDPRTYGNLALRSRAESVVASMQSLDFRPLLLAHVRDILAAEDREWNVYRLYEALFEAWLLREETKLRDQLDTPPDKETLWSVCATVAQHMQQRGSCTLSRAELDELVRGLPPAAHLKDFDVGGRSLLNRNAEYAYRFSHYSIQEFLVAHALVTRPLEAGEEKLRATDQMLGFIDEAGGLDFALLDRVDLGDFTHKGVPSSSFHDRLADGSRGPPMRLIPAGAFLMGSAWEGKEALPRHRVHIPEPFALGTYPVTFIEYDRFAEATGRKKPDDEGWGRERRPVIYVSWEDARAYCEWLSDQTGKPYRLPTEAEWEYAVRAGSETEYWWGDTQTGVAEHAWHKKNSNGKTQPVGQKPPNPWGLFDTSCNILEWVQDCWHDSYEGAPDDGSAWESSECEYRSLRGGSWLYEPRRIRYTARLRHWPPFCHSLIGFRLARTL